MSFSEISPGSNGASPKDLTSAPSSRCPIVVFAAIAIWDGVFERLYLDESSDKDAAIVLSARRCISEAAK